MAIDDAGQGEKLVTALREGKHQRIALQIVEGMLSGSSFQARPTHSVPGTGR
jgi:hypothetical protein